jgi:hypothetical protein
MNVVASDCGHWLSKCVMHLLTLHFLLAVSVCPCRQGFEGQHHHTGPSRAAHAPDAADCYNHVLKHMCNMFAPAGKALKDNITTLGPRVLPMSEMLVFGANMIARKLLKMRVVPYVPDFQVAAQHICIHTGEQSMCYLHVTWGVITVNCVLQLMCRTSRWQRSTSSSTQVRRACVSGMLHGVLSQSRCGWPPMCQTSRWQRSTSASTQVSRAFT